MAFASLSEMRKSKSGFDKLLQEAEKTFEGGRNEPEFWQPTVDKAGNGWAVIRFLPAPQGEDLAWVKVYDHGFKGPTGKWYIEKSRTTLGEPDPVAEFNSTLWNSGNEALKKQAQAQKRRLSYISNILVIQDPGNPDNNGKVFPYKYGKKIFEKIKDKLKPEFPDEAPVNPFDFWEGANFKLKIRKVEGYRNYDKSEFDASAPISEDDEEIERIWKSCTSLTQYIDPATFKPYDVLKKKLESVLNSGGGESTASTAADVGISDEAFIRAATAAAASRVTRADEKVSDSTPATPEDDPIAFFSNLADDD